MRHHRSTVAAVLALSLLNGCGQQDAPSTLADMTRESRLSLQAAEQDRFKSFIAEASAADLARDPTLRTMRNKTGEESTWTPVSQSFRDETAALLRKRLTELPGAVTRDRLSPSAQIEYDIYAASLAGRALEEETRARAYFINGNAFNFNILEEPSRVLQASHRISSVQDARNYLARMDAIPALLTDALDLARERQSRGVTMIATAFAPIVDQMTAAGSGAPCGGEGENPLWTDFNGKIGALADAPSDDLSMLREAARVTLIDKVCPAYTAYASSVSAMAADARSEGLWTTPGGKEAYRDIVALNLGAPADPEEIHELGLREVERLSQEIAVLEATLGFEGDLPAIEAALRERDETSLPNTEEGRAAYLALAQAYTDEMWTRLPAYFELIPSKRPLIIRMGAIGSQYTTEDIDGVNVGVYNLMTPRGERISTVGLATLSYHEGVPGHHLQLATSEEIREGQDLFQRPFNAAYTEGWALYAERLADEMGAYADNPFGRLGYLRSMRGRAARLVLDTGLNFKEWTVDQAQTYQREALGEAGGLGRYLNWPGQALGYYWGYLEYMRLRDRAEAALGDRFDIKGFHLALMRNGGAVPFPILLQVVDQWIAQRLEAPAGAGENAAD